MTYESKTWGISVFAKERLETKHGKGMPFSVVVTLKEINGINRHSEFVQTCELRGWIVNRVDVKKHIDIYLKAEEDISFE